MANLEQHKELCNDFNVNENEEDTAADTIYTKEEILKNMFKKCRTEADNEDLEIPISRVVERVSNYTGLSIDTLSNIYINENITYQASTIGLSSKIEIYKCLKELYINKIPPTYNTIYKLMNKLINLDTFSQFKTNMILLGYNYYTTASGVRMLLEDPKITFERYFYLNNIIQIRKKNKQTVYYIDERIIDTRLTFQKPWIDNIDDASVTWQGYIILHVISGKQFVNSLYCNRVSKQDFKKWIYDIVLNKLNPNSVIVMDNNTLHGTFDRMSLSKYDTKEVMLNWLYKNNVPCTSNMHRAELYQLYRKTPKGDIEYDIDRILKAHGHDVLRLPNSLHDLSPTNLFWDCIRCSYVPSIDSITHMSADTLYTVKSRINSFIKKYTEATWTKFEKEIIAMEKQVYEFDAEIENVIDGYLKEK